jgi:hypothetical protein
VVTLAPPVDEGESRKMQEFNPHPSQVQSFSSESRVLLSLL